MQHFHQQPPTIQFVDWARYSIPSNKIGKDSEFCLVYIMEVNDPTTQKKWMLSHRYEAFYKLRNALLDIEHFKSMKCLNMYYKALKKSKFPKRKFFKQSMKLKTITERYPILEQFIQKTIDTLYLIKLLVRGHHYTLMDPLQPIFLEYQALLCEFLSPAHTIQPQMSKSSLHTEDQTPKFKTLSIKSLTKYRKSSGASTASSI